jgi:hypothetical protein
MPLRRRPVSRCSSVYRQPAAAAGSAGEVMTGDQIIPASRTGLAAHATCPSGRPLRHKGEIPGSRAYHGAVTDWGMPAGDRLYAILRVLTVPARSGGHR